MGKRGEVKIRAQSLTLHCFRKMFSGSGNPYIKMEVEGLEKGK